MSIIRLVSIGVRNPKRALSVISHKLFSVVGHNEFRRFIVLSRSRAGSNLLISLLNSHPNIHVDREIFSKLNGRDYKKVIKRAFGKQPFYVKAKGFKIFYYHPLDDKSCGIWDNLASLDDLYVIHLKRRNILHTLVSRKFAEITDVWSVRSDLPSSSFKKEVSVSFTIDELNQGFKQTKEWEEAGDNAFRNHPLLSIDYEELVNHPTAAFFKLIDFLGVQQLKLQTKLKKQNTRTLRETVTNYDELKSAFAETEWAPFFED